MKKKEPIALLGGGSWGTALASLMADQNHPVDLWVHNPDLANTMQKTGENPDYMPGFSLPSLINPLSDMERVLAGKKFVLAVIPSHYLREVMSQAAPFIEEDAVLLSATKGIEQSSLKLVDEILRDVLPDSLHANLSYLSGPSFAREVMEQLPSGVVVASKSQAVAQRVQEQLNTSYFRVYWTEDVKGALLGGAVKNVIAIACGISDGLKLGLNSRAALITRGLAEITRLGEAMGANPMTLSGLAGMGDLVLTCTGSLSRNRTVGFKLGEGHSLEDILEDMKMVAEGVKTARAVRELAKKNQVEMPIVEQVSQILYQKKSPQIAVEELMTRPLKAE